MYVRMGKSATACKWEAVFIRRVRVYFREPYSSEAREGHHCTEAFELKEREDHCKEAFGFELQKAEDTSSKKRGEKVDDDVSCIVILAL